MRHVQESLYIIYLNNRVTQKYLAVTRINCMLPPPLLFPLSPVTSEEWNANKLTHPRLNLT